MDNRANSQFERSRDLQKLLQIHTQALALRNYTQAERQGGFHTDRAEGSECIRTIPHHLA